MYNPPYPCERPACGDWDCGLACVQMALLSLDVPPPACSLKQLRARLSSDSVWTADLVYLLASYGIQCEYLTSELSAGATSAEKAGSRWYIHARNIAAAVLFVLEHGQHGEKYNVQGEIELDNLEIGRAHV